MAECRFLTPIPPHGSDENRPRTEPMGPPPGNASTCRHRHRRDAWGEADSQAGGDPLRGPRAGLTQVLRTRSRSGSLRFPTAATGPESSSLAQITLPTAWPHSVHRRPSDPAKWLWLRGLPPQPAPVLAVPRVSSFTRSEARPEIRNRVHEQRYAGLRSDGTGIR
jgi:hypothetical protein